MKQRNTIFLLAIFVILLILFFVSKITDRAVGKRELLVEVDTSKVDRIHIVSPENGEVLLALENGVWRLKQPLDFQAEARSVHNLLDKLDDMIVESIASTRKDKWEEYEVNDSLGTLVELMSGDKQLVSFYMGKKASTRRHTYFRKSGDNSIYMVKGSYNYFFDRKLKDWRNKMILEVNPDGIESIRISYPDHSFTLTLKDSVWWLDEGKTEFEASLKAVDPMINYISRLRAGDFHDIAEGEESPDFSQPACYVEITFDGGYKEGLSLIPEDEDAKRYLIKKDSEDVIYVIYKGTANILMKDIEDFRIREEPKRPGDQPEPKKMN